MSGASPNDAAAAPSTPPALPQCLLDAVMASRHSRRDVSTVVQSVCRPLLANLMRDFENKKFRVVKNSSKLVVQAKQCGGPATVDALMHMVGFSLVAASSPTSAMADAPAAAAIDAVVGNSDSHSADDSGWCSAAMHLHDGDASVWQFTWPSMDTLIAANRQLTELEDLCAQPWADSEDMDAAALAKAAAARQMRRDAERQQERDAQRARQLKLHAQDAEERRGEKTLRDCNETQERANLDEDFAFAKQFIDVARKTLHHSGRLRNASFEAKHFQLCRMRTVRGFACTTCPPDNLEAHWHVINGSLLYAYCVHLTPDAGAVVHSGYEHAYQYNAMPGTPHFGKTVWMTTKHVDGQTGKLDLLQHHDKPVERCIYCNVPFRQLFL